MVSNCGNVPEKVVTEKPVALCIISPICRKSEKLRNHLQKCPLVPSKIWAEALSPTDKDKRMPRQVHQTWQAPVIIRPDLQKKPKRAMQAQPSLSPPLPSTKGHSPRMSANFCVVQYLVECSEHPEIRLFMGNGFWMSLCRIGILYQGKFWTVRCRKLRIGWLVSDRKKWQRGSVMVGDNIAKTHVVTSMMMVEPKVSLAVCETTE